MCFVFVVNEKHFGSFILTKLILKVLINNRMKLYQFFSFQNNQKLFPTFVFGSLFCPLGLTDFSHYIEYVI
jgi:hypothetical protein